MNSRRQAKEAGRVLAETKRKQDKEKKDKEAGKNLRKKREAVIQTGEQEFIHTGTTFKVVCWSSMQL